MICRDCPAAKRITSERIECIQYGMILLWSHECDREGWKDYEQYVRDREVIGEGTGFHEDGGGTAEAVPGVLPGPGEREAV